MSVLDNIRDFLTLKVKPARNVDDGEDDYVLHDLAKGSFQMTEALWRRQQYEAMLKRYDIAPNRDGGVI